MSVIPRLNDPDDNRATYQHSAASELRASSEDLSESVNLQKFLAHFERSWAQIGPRFSTMLPRGLKVMAAPLSAEG